MVMVRVLLKSRQMGRSWVCFWSILSILLLSCSQERELQTKDVDSRGYIDFLLDASAAPSGDETPKALFTHKDGEALQFRFADLSAKPGAEIPVRTHIFNGSSEVYSGTLNWKVANQGKRLTYRGKLKIKADLLKNASRNGLSLVALFDDGTVDYKIHDLREEQEIKVPYYMKTRVVQIKDTLSVLDSELPKFKPWGTLARIEVKNEMPVPVLIDGFLFYDVHTKYTLNVDGEAVLDTKEASMSHGADYINTGVYVFPGHSEHKYFYAWLPLYKDLPKLKAFGGGEKEATKVRNASRDGVLSVYRFTYKQLKTTGLPNKLIINEERIAQIAVEDKALYKSYDLYSGERDLGDKLLVGFPKLEPYFDAYMAALGADKWQEHASGTKATVGRKEFTSVISGHSYIANIEVLDGWDDYAIINVVDKSNRRFVRYHSYREKDTRRPILEVSFLPYNASEEEQALRSSYWTQHASEKKVVYFPFYNNFPSFTTGDDIIIPNDGAIFYLPEYSRRHGRSAVSLEVKSSRLYVNTTVTSNNFVYYYFDK